MDSVVVSGVHGGELEDLIEEGVECLMAGKGEGLIAGGVLEGGIFPDVEDEEGLGFDVLRLVLDESFEGADVFAAGFGVVFTGVEIGEGIDPGLFAGGCSGFAGDGLFDEFLGAFFVVDIGHGEAPVGHRAAGVEESDLAEGAFGFVIPEAVELSDGLIEELLSGGDFGGDGEMDLSGIAHEVGTLAGTFVEGFAVHGMAGEGSGWFGFFRRQDGVEENVERRKEKKGTTGTGHTDLGRKAGG